MNVKVFVSAFILAILCIAGPVCAEDLGALSPQKALDYMKANSDLVIVDTALPEYYEKQHFTGAINIPAKEMAERYEELPQNGKVMLHCRIGKTCLSAYKILQEKRPDLELSYIGGSPLFDAYNEWVIKNRK